MGKEFKKYIHFKFMSALNKILKYIMDKILM